MNWTKTTEADLKEMARRHERELTEKGDGHTLVIVGCGKTKLAHAAPAGRLYTGPLFKAAAAWARANGEHWVIASAAHGLVAPDRELEPYDRTLSSLGREDVRQWAAWCQVDLARHWNTHGFAGRVVILAGAAYVDPLLEWTSLRSLVAKGLTVVDVPLAGLGVGERLAWFKRERAAA